MAEKKSVGLDIGSCYIKVVELEKSGPIARLVTCGTVPTPPSATASDSSLDKETLAESIKKLISEAKIDISSVTSALPESQIFTRVIELPVLSDKELGSAIQWEAEQYIPVPLSEVSLGWQVLSKPQTTTGAKMEVLLIAAPKTLVEKYMKILEMARLKLSGLETEVLSMSRALVGNNPYSPTTLIISIGASTTDLCIVRNGMVAFVRSIATGGVAFTRSIAQELSFEIDQAEEYKKSYGLLEDQLEGKIFHSLKPIIDLVVTEIKRVLVSYQGKRPDDPVKRAVICGGSARMPGIVVYLAAALGLEVQIGDPWFNIKRDPNSKLNTLITEEAPLYTIATGLALKGL